MIRRVIFDSSSKHANFFTLTFEAAYSRGSAARDVRVSKEDKKADGAIMRALKAISDPIGDPIPEGALDYRLRKLKPEGGVLELPQKPEFSRLVKFVEDCQFPASVCDVEDELEQFLDAAEKVEPGKLEIVRDSDSAA